MNQNQILSLIRSVLLGIGATFVTKGTLTDSLLQEIVGSILGLGSLIWSQWHHAKTPPTP